MPDRWQELAASSRKPRTLVCNLYGGPGTGKSTTAAGLFYWLKSWGVTAELVTEFAKDLVWEQRHATLQDQIYVFGKQQHRLTRLLDQVEVIITDAPIMLTPVYSGGYTALDDLAYDLYKTMRNFDVFLVRNNAVHPYNERGRYQKLNEAEQVDRDIRSVLETYQIDTRFIQVSDDTVPFLAQDIWEVVRAATF